MAPTDQQLLRQANTSSEWPLIGVKDFVGRKPPIPPYLSRPPAVIDISTGRQLFVDDYLVARSSASRTFHQAVLRDIVLEPIKSEMMVQGDKYSNSGLGFRYVATSRPFSGGVWYDGCKKRFVMHYRCRYEYTRHGQGCVAYSDDGMHWVRPKLFDTPLQPNRASRCTNCPPVPAPSNRINCAQDTEAFTSWLDHAEPERQHRWKAVAIVTKGPIASPMSIWSSADGERWSRLVQRNGGIRTGQVTDRATFFYNPFRKRWAYSMRENLCHGGHGHMRISRIKEVAEVRDSMWPNWVRTYFQCSAGKPTEPLRWVGVDKWDCEGKNVAECDLYHVDATAYESLMVGQFAVLYPGAAHGGCKSSHVHVAFSRDGFHWSRASATEKNPRLPLVNDALGLRYQQPIAGNMIVVGDELFIYYGGATRCRRCNISPLGVVGTDAYANKTKKFCNGGDPARDGPVSTHNSSMSEVTALAILRRDGFASLAPPEGADGAHVTTHPLSFASGRLLFVNVDASAGELVVLAEQVPRGEEAGALRSVPLRNVNSTRLAVVWGGDAEGDAMGAFEGKPFRLHFILRKARLFSFWMSNDAAGHSSGYVQGPQYGQGVDSSDKLEPRCRPP